jgi:hypothetical protein
MQHVFAFGITLLPFVSLSVNSLYFILLLQNHLGKFNQVWLGYIFDRAVKKCVSSPLQLNKMATKAPHSLKIFEITAQMENSYNRHQISVTVYVIQLDFCQIFLRIKYKEFTDRLTKGSNVMPKANTCCMLLDDDIRSILDLHA